MRCAKSVLREYGLKYTGGREALLNVLLSAEQPLTHKEICQKLVHDYNPVSIYRSLDSYIKLGLAHRIAGEDGTWLFALNSCDGEPHPHFFCRSCGKYECLRGIPVPEIAGISKHYLIEEKVSYVKGLCSDCTP